MSEIIAAMIAALGVFMLRQVINDKQRMSIASVIIISLIGFMVCVYCAQWLWGLIVSSRESFGLKPYPEIFYEVYSAWELWLSPVLTTLIVYSFIPVGLSLKCWPEDASEEQRLKRAQTILLRYCQVLWAISIVLFLYASHHWLVWWISRGM